MCRNASPPCRKGLLGWRVLFSRQGLGLTSMVLRDARRPIGMQGQALTVRANHDGQSAPSVPIVKV